jgi:hypothetical protein
MIIAIFPLQVGVEAADLCVKIASSCRLARGYLKNEITKRG